MKKPGAMAGLGGVMGLREAFATGVGVVFTVVGIAVAHAALLGAFEGNVTLIVVFAAIFITGVIAAVSLGRQ